MELNELSAAVIKILMSEHDFLIDEAEEKVNESMDDRPELWNENAEPENLAKFLASDDDDE